MFVHSSLQRCRNFVLSSVSCSISIVCRVHCLANAVHINLQSALIRLKLGIDKSTRKKNDLREMTQNEYLACATFNHIRIVERLSLMPNETN